MQESRSPIPGLNTVQISTQADPYEDIDGNNVPSSPETIPMKYNTQSELEFEVIDGEANVANFELDSSGEIAASEEEGY